MRTQDDFQFIINNIGVSPDGALLHGRCGRGRISVGDKLTRIYEYIDERDPEGLPTAGALIPLPERHVNLTVIRVTVPYKRLGWVDEGYTAVLGVTGEGTAHLRAARVLGGEKSKPADKVSAGG